jgi:hypothetical protein
LPKRGYRSIRTHAPRAGGEIGASRTSLAVICRTRQIDAPVVFSGFRTHRMPHRINGTACVSGYGYSAVTAFRILHEVALRLECLA